MLEIINKYHLWDYIDYNGLVFLIVFLILYYIYLESDNIYHCAKTCFKKEDLVVDQPATLKKQELPTKRGRKKKVSVPKQD